MTAAALGISVTVFPAAQAQPGPGPADNVGSTSPRSFTPRGTRISRDDHLPSAGAGPLPPPQGQASSSAGGSLPAGQPSQDRGRLGGGGGSIGQPPLAQAGATSSTGQQAGPIQAGVHRSTPNTAESGTAAPPHAHQQGAAATAGMATTAQHQPPHHQASSSMPQQIPWATGGAQQPQPAHPSWTRQQPDARWSQAQAQPQAANTASSSTHPEKAEAAPGRTTKQSQPKQTTKGGDRLQQESHQVPVPFQA